MSSCPRVALFGPIAKEGRPARGGYEAANRKTVEELRRRGMAVQELHFETPRGQALKNVYNFCGNWIALMRLFFSSRKGWDILHITGLPDHFVYVQSILLLGAHMLGKKVVYDMRAGRYIKSYNINTKLYRWALEKVMARSDGVAVEGTKYIDFVKEKGHREAFYLPNFVNEPPRYNPRLADPGDTIKMVYLGRVTLEKGVEQGLRVRQMLEQRGYKAEFKIVGLGEKALVDRLTKAYESPDVIWTGPVTVNAVRDTIAGSHFFFFATRHPGEGHSNALTDCMAEGVVPVCSDHGFNAGIVSDCGRVLPPDATDEAYVEAILGVWTTGGWPTLSRMCTDRITNHYCADRVMDGLIDYYRRVLMGQTKLA